MRNVLTLRDNVTLETKAVIIETNGIEAISIIKESLTRIFNGFPVNWELTVEREINNSYVFLITDTLTESLRAVGYLITQPELQAI